MQDRSKDTTRRTADLGRTFREIRRDYAYDGSVFTDDDALMRKTKWVIEHKLTAADRTIIILYAELGSYRKLGKRLGLSHTTIKNEVHRIRKIVKENL